MGEPLQLKRQLGLPGAVLMGLGSIVGTGVFVSIGLAAGVAGPGVVLATALAAAVAACNALSSAQLAANYPVSGGTYEYGHQYLTPTLGFVAGWMFLCAKAASAATAAIGLSGYALSLAGVESPAGRTALAVGVVAALTLVVLGGIRLSNQANTVMVMVTLCALTALVAAAAPRVASMGTENLRPVFGASPGGFLQATALMFVAYTGYGRIATLGEEVHEPRRTIPRAIILTLAISAALYVAVGLAAVGSVGAKTLSESTRAGATPLEEAARRLNVPGLGTAVAVGAITAMLGVLLNLILGLSRVALAMGRRGDLPGALAKVNAARTTPGVAVGCVGAVIALLAGLGSVKTAWSFSAFTALIYYAITNMAALRLPRAQRLYPAALAWCGLGACLFLAFWVEWRVWAVGLAVIAAGLAGRWGKKFLISDF